MTDSHNIQLLKENLIAMDSTISWLTRSIGICDQIGIKSDYTEEEYDAVETFEDILNQTPLVIALARRIKDHAVRYVNMSST